MRQAESMKFLKDAVWRYLARSYKANGRAIDGTNSIDIFAVLVRHLFTANPPFVIQIGANDGKMADPLCGLITPEWRGLLVEPHPEAFAQLQKTYQGFSKLKLVQCAVTERSETVTLQLCKNTVESTITRGDVKNLTGSVNVQGQTLQMLLQDHAISRADIMVVDTEGYDYKIVKQIFDTKVRPTILQFEHTLMEPHQYDELLKLMTQSKYSFSQVGVDTVATQFNPRA